MQAWHAQTKAQKSASYATSKVGLKLHVGSKIGYIEPFGDGTSVFIKTPFLIVPTTTATATQSSNNPLITAVSNTVLTKWAKLTGPTVTPHTIVGHTHYKLARVFAKEIRTAGVPKVSRITGHPYSHAETDTASTPFGLDSTAAALLQNDLMLLIKLELL